ncbi:MAG: C10 family peptidase, partial [Kiritimatiellae bacterium]|nr:C10 family peptidase [Kiritimatiellia bacterium]
RRAASAPDAPGAEAAPPTVVAAPTAAQKRWADLLSEEEDVLPTAGTGVDSIPDVRVDSFIQSSWNQKTSDNYTGSTLTCYNYYTPNNYYCGCTATAYAQVMRHYRFPAGSVAPKTWTCKVDNVSTDKTMMGGSYAWDDMPLRPWESTPTETQRQEIGKLCYDVGVAACMNWRSSGSGASIHCAAMGLKEDFGYASAVSFYYNSSYPYSLDEFKKAVIPSLDARSPVVLDIYNSSGDTGHSILADGYGYSESDFFLHLNFGWGSRKKVAYNIWYVPPDLKPSDDHPYDTIRGLVCNIFPDKSGNVFSGRVLDPEGIPLEGVSVSLDGGTSVTTDSRGVYAFVTTAGSHVATATRSGSSASVSKTLPTMVPTRFVGRPSSSYYPAACTVGNSGGNDIVLHIAQDTAPAISSATVTDVSFTSASIVVSVSDLGTGSTFADVSATVGGTTKTGRVNANGGSATLSFTDLSAGMQYTATVTATGSNGLSATRTVTFSTAAYTAPALGTVSSSATTTSVTLSVPVTALGKGAASVSVAATLGGATKTATVSAAGGTATLAFDGLAP